MDFFAFFGNTYPDPHDVVCGVKHSPNFISCSRLENRVSKNETRYQ